MYTNGPIAMSRDERLQLCDEILERLHKAYQQRVLAVGVYGSVARGTDGPYSDVEMLCVVRDASGPADFSHEWSAGPWKAEVNILSADTLLQEASTVEGEWPLTHGPYFAPLPLYDPGNFFPLLKKAAESPTEADFTQAINEVLVGEMCEYIGKLRNTTAKGSYTYLPYLTMQFAHYGAMLIGLHNRKLYTTGAQVLPEAVQLPGRPAGYDRVAGLVMSGELTDGQRLIEACEKLWSGLVQWADKHGYTIASECIPF